MSKSTKARLSLSDEAFSLFAAPSAASEPSAPAGLIAASILAVEEPPTPAGAWVSTSTSETELQHLMHARYYNNAVGRMLGVDSGPASPTMPVSWNRYSYCSGNPIKYLDPTGDTITDSNGKEIVFDKNGDPQFSKEQLDLISQETVEALRRYAQTEEGSKMIAVFTTGARKSDVVSLAERPESDFRGPNVVARYDEPLAQVLKNNPSQPMGFLLLINKDNPPAIDLSKRPGTKYLDGTTESKDPTNLVDHRMLAIGGEFIHILLRTRGIPNPPNTSQEHHRRGDFKTMWRRFVTEVGYPLSEHVTVH